MTNIQGLPELKFIRVTEPTPHVALVELNRGPVNAFSEAFWQEYSTVFQALSTTPSDIRAIVLASALPKLFTAGIDVSELGSLHAGSDGARTAAQLYPYILGFQDCISAPERCPVPVIAAVHGVAVGLAIDIIAACDVRYAAKNAVFAIKEVDVGLAADIGTLARTPKNTASLSHLSELAFTGRNFSAAEALQLGLVSKVVDGSLSEVKNAALELAKLIASKSPVAVSGTKHLILHARDHSVEENLKYTAVWNAGMLQTNDMVHTLRAFKTKEVPTFEPMRKAKL